MHTEESDNINHVIRIIRNNIESCIPKYKYGGKDYVLGHTPISDVGNIVVETISKFLRHQANLIDELRTELDAVRKYENEQNNQENAT